MKLLLIILIVLSANFTYAKSCSSELSSARGLVGTMSDDYGYNYSESIFGIANFATRNLDESLMVFENYVERNSYRRAPLDYNSVKTGIATMRSLQQNYVMMKMKLFELQLTLETLDRCLKNNAL